MARGDGMRGDDDDEGSDLAANADQIITGGAMSILRRKGKQGKERRRDRDVGRTGKLTNELLSSDILSLLQIFHEEANTGTSVSTLHHQFSLSRLLTLFNVAVGNARSIKRHG